jgi:hypothetical protein
MPPTTQELHQTFLHSLARSNQDHPEPARADPATSFRREPGPDWYLGAASALTGRLDASVVADFVVDNDERAPDEVAAEILGLVGWLG